VDARWDPGALQLQRSKAKSLWWQPVDGSRPAELVYQAPDAIREGVFTLDGGTIIFRTDTPWW
jgi:hypothetical protein